ncbi:MAG: autotransporter outer membrane beta-barrel domain-containing protein [Candidatus Rickettsia vulgarisii]
MAVPFFNRPDRTAKTLYNLGASVTAKRGKMEYSAGYDSYLAKKYTAHQGTLKIRVNF